MTSLLACGYRWTWWTHTATLYRKRLAVWSLWDGWPPGLLKPILKIHYSTILPKKEKEISKGAISFALALNLAIDNLSNLIDPVTTQSNTYTCFKVRSQMTQRSSICYPHRRMINSMEFYIWILSNGFRCSPLQRFILENFLLIENGRELHSGLHYISRLYSLSFSFAALFRYIILYNADESW